MGADPIDQIPLPSATDQTVSLAQLMTVPLRDRRLMMVALDIMDDMTTVRDVFERAHKQVSVAAILAGRTMLVPLMEEMAAHLDSGVNDEAVEERLVARAIHALCNKPDTSRQNG